MSSLASEQKAFRTFDLIRSREDCRPRREPAPHQVEALAKLRGWFSGRHKGRRGAIVVLPTGGGKTFTAVRFLCTEPLSAGYKVLWLAHTHHLLEQAADAFGREESACADEAVWIAESKAELDIRVVSGTTGHCRVHEIRDSDDVVVCTLPSAARALRDGHPALTGFLNAAGDRLAVVFDEAHHAPAPTYARLMEDLRARCPSLLLLGLTATPTYAEESRRGWLKKLFPQEILHQASVSKLMASGILARPHFEQVQTRFVPRFSEREYAKWVATYQDLPEHIITSLAESRERNDFVVDSYVRDRERYGRTIIFADRWYQCDYLREALRKRGVRADVVYSHVAVDKGGADERNRRTADDNAKVLQQFRNGALDVLINVRMLTEGTDVPNVQTVFLTRQTTSQVLLTQMIGRALRGPAFGGTENAFIVSFVDEWTVPISWAATDRLQDGGTRADSGAPGERAPVQLLSIELVRRLARELISPGTAPKATYLSHVPVGWYRAEFETRVIGTEDIEQVRQLVMVLDSEQGAYDRFVGALVNSLPKPLVDVLRREDLALEEVGAQLDAWAREYFGEDAPEDSRLVSLLFLARHVAQAGSRPPFFAFAERKDHNLDAVARHCVAAGLGPVQLHQTLRAEFDRQDRYWRALYPSFELFARHYHGAQLRVLTELEHGGPLVPRSGSGSIKRKPPELPEPSAAVKRAVHTRDGDQCLCCGARRGLQVDHIAPSYLGGTHAMDNLQTLCRTCNADKGITELNFRRHDSPLQARPAFALLRMPRQLDPRSVDDWEQHIRRTLNFFYRCAAVQNVTIKRRGPDAGRWKATLYPGNDERWALVRYRGQLCDQIEEVRATQGLAGPFEFTVEGAARGAPRRRLKEQG